MPRHAAAVDQHPRRRLPAKPTARAVVARGWGGRGREEPVERLREVKRGVFKTRNLRRWFPLSRRAAGGERVGRACGG